MKLYLSLLLALMSLSVLTTESLANSAKKRQKRKFNTKKEVVENTKKEDVVSVKIHSAHTLNKRDYRYFTGDIRVYVNNDSSDDITSVQLTLKSKNQQDRKIADWSSIKKDRGEKGTDRIDIEDLEYPYVICTFSMNGKKYEQRFDY